MMLISSKEYDSEPTFEAIVKDVQAAKGWERMCTLVAYVKTIGEIPRVLKS